METKQDNEPSAHTSEKAQQNEQQEAPAEYSDDNLTAIDKQYAAQTGIPRRIHILGTGSIGKLVAHSLMGLAKPPPITLLLHRYNLLKAWEEGKKQITIHDDGYDVSRGGFDVELMQETRREHGVQIEDGQPGVYDIADSEGSGGNVRPHEAAEALKEMQLQRQQAEEDGQQQSSAGSGETSQKQQPTQPGHHAISDEPIHNLIVTTKAAVTVSAISAIKHRLSSSSTVCFLQNGMGIIDELNKELFPKEEDRPNYM